jgi:hypothetical protein
METVDIAELIKQARAQGCVVITPPGWSAETCSIDALVAAACLQFDLRRSEGRALVQLAKRNLVTKEELQLAISGRPISGSKIAGSGNTEWQGIPVWCGSVEDHQSAHRHVV